MDWRRSRSRRRPSFRPSDPRGIERLETREVPATVPPGFTATLVAGGLGATTSMDVAPDGRVFVSEQQGSISVIEDGRVLPTPFLTVPVPVVGERGLLGVVLDPDFAATGHVYIYYTTAGVPMRNRLSRFTAAGNVAAPGSEVVLLELPPIDPERQPSTTAAGSISGPTASSTSATAITRTGPGPRTSTAHSARFSASTRTA